MKQFSKILSFLLLTFLLTAEDCSDRSVEVTKEDSMTDMFQDIENEFVNDELTPNILFAFEKRAVQKLSDLDDYLNIYADTSLSKEFRLQARQMIIESFNDKINLQKYYQNLALLEDTVHLYLHHSVNTEPLCTEINSILVSDSFQKKTMLGYTGELQFTQKIFRIVSGDTLFMKTFNIHLEIITSRTEKEFGNQIQNVWEIYLGETR